MMNDKTDLENRKILAVLCHASQLFSSLAISIAVPIIILIISEDPIVQAHAKEAINFAISVILYAIICLILTIVVFGISGISLFVLLFIGSWMLPIFAVVRAATMPDIPYRYPFVMRFV
ncbi:DUF4870 domain-containing protein [Leptolyngbya sp. AN02str]|uniref:DUF4870 domain-containing protein n=1 Tax=Leptolyngbya sp. AN02str TaxID=3423363 RepID=UPI003D31654C